MPRPIAARIDLGALRHNLRVVRTYAGRARVMAVAKAAAYGHGLLRVLPVLKAADGIALLDIADAIAVREAGYAGPVLLLEGAFSDGDVETAARYRLHCVVHEAAQLERHVRLRGARVAGVFLKVNTGMHRLGFPASAVPAAVQRLRSEAGLADITLMTHFAAADEGREVDVQQLRFEAACAGLALPWSAANSAAAIRYPETRGDWIRPGIALYGATPFADQSARDLGLQPVMTLTSELIAVQDVAPGGAVGYGGVFVAERQMRVGIVACGYADGYPRHAPTGTPVLVDGVRTRTVGRVSMDMTMVDLSPCPGAHVGMPVTLWGEGLPVDEVAAAAGTVGYELLCALAPRVPVAVTSAGEPAAGGPAS